MSGFWEMRKIEMIQICRILIFNKKKEKEKKSVLLYSIEQNLN